MVDRRYPCWCLAILLFMVQPKSIPLIGLVSTSIHPHGPSIMSQQSNVVWLWWLVTLLISHMWSLCITCTVALCLWKYFLVYFCKCQASDLQITQCTDKQKNAKPETNSLVFGANFSDHMLEVEWREDRGWGKPKICPVHNLVFHPAAKVFHYAIEVRNSSDISDIYYIPYGNIFH